jgi:hypothetical protein
MSIHPAHVRLTRKVIAQRRGPQIAAYSGRQKPNRCAPAELTMHAADKIVRERLDLDLLSKRMGQDVRVLTAGHRFEQPDAPST